jgi:DHA2 family multidrug resistance protein
MEETLNANSAAVQDYVGGLGSVIGQTGSQTGGGIALLAQQIGREALVMTYNDIFWIMGVGTFAVLPLVLFLKPLPKRAGPAMVH